MMGLPVITVERTLAQLRWRPADFLEESLLQRIVAHDSYWLLLRRGDPMLAPDDERARRLVAVFTSAPARDAFIHDTNIAPGSGEMRRLDGASLFKTLRMQRCDGIVFNCAGPDRPIAFVNELIDSVQPFVGKPRDTRPLADAERIDFDAMAADAYPVQRAGDRADVELLWRGTYALAEWFAVVHDTPAKALLTRRDRDGRLSAFLFTDRRRAERFIEINDLNTPAAGRVASSVMTTVATMSPRIVLDWSRRGSFPIPVERLHFNFGFPGWFSPADNLARLYDHLQAKAV